MTKDLAYEVGRVYDNLPQALTYYNNADQYAKSYFSLRNLTRSYNLDSLKEKIDQAANKLVVRHLLEIRQLNLRFLDIGGARGNRLLDIESIFGKPLDKYLVDIDELSVDKARQRGIKAIQVDLNGHLPYPDSYFDAVSLMWVISCLPPNRINNLIYETHRILKPDGVFFIVDEKYGVFSGDEDYYKNVLKPLGYARETFFAGIFEPTGIIGSPKEAPESILEASDRNPAYRLVSLPFAIHLIQLEQLKQETKNYFDFKNVYLFESANNDQLGQVLSSDIIEIEQRYKNAWGVFLSILIKK